MITRPLEQSDRSDWQRLWEGYNTFYGRAGATALPADTTDVTWRRFFDANEPVWCCVAETDGQLAGLVHFVFHRSTTRVTDVCYLQDLFTDEALRGRGVGRALINAVYDAASLAGATRVYWQTQASNTAGRLLYDQVSEHRGFIVYSTELDPRWSRRRRVATMRWPGRV